MPLGINFGILKPDSVSGFSFIRFSTFQSVRLSKVMFKLKASGNLSFEDTPDVISAISLGFCLCAAIHGTNNKDGANVRG